MKLFSPKCTIYRDWGGPRCGKPAISRNDFGGYQCEFHGSFGRHPENKPGKFRVITGKTLLSRLYLRIAYVLFLLKDSY